MKFVCIVTVALLLSSFAFSQSFLTGSVGYSFHGTGDLRGHNVAFGYRQQIIKKPLSLSATLRSTTGNNALPLYYTDPDGHLVNSTYRFITSGTQLELAAHYAVINLPGYSLELGAGGVLRYQVSNLNADVYFLYPTLTGYPIPLISLNEVENYKSFTAGYLLRIDNNFRISEKVTLGFSINLQNDTKGQLIWNLPANVRYRIAGKRKDAAAHQ